MHIWHITPPLRPAMKEESCQVKSPEVQMSFSCWVYHIPDSSPRLFFCASLKRRLYCTCGGAGLLLSSGWKKLANSTSPFAECKKFTVHNVSSFFKNLGATCFVVAFLRCNAARYCVCDDVVTFRLRYVFGHVLDGILRTVIDFVVRTN